jgi:hypothetical protein
VVETLKTTELRAEERDDHGALADGLG